MTEALKGDADLEQLFSIRRSCERTSTPRAPKKAGDQAFGHSRGGLSTKIHAAVEALGNPLRWRLTVGHLFIPTPPVSPPPRAGKS